MEELGKPHAGTDIWANPYDLNDDDQISYRDLILFASVYNSVSAESSSDYSWFSDYNQNQRVDYRDLIYLASIYNKSKLQLQQTTPSVTPRIDSLAFQSKTWDFPGILPSNRS